MKDDTMTTEEVKHLSHLANLPLSAAEVDSFTTQLRQTIEYVDNLNELDTASVEPTSHTGGQSNVRFEDGTPNSRGLTPEQATANSGKKKNGYFIVTRIM